MLKVGIIGYGRRISHMAKAMDVFGIPYRVVAIVDPRAPEILGASDPFLGEAVSYSSAEEMLVTAQLDGVMIGTRCYLHSEMACKVAPYNLPLFLEKPVAITFDQLKSLDEAFGGFSAPTVVSFPLRLSPVAQTVKEMIDSDVIGTVEEIIAFNDVPYGVGYFRGWHRNYEQDGGLWMQKATHDLDYMAYLVGQSPRLLCAMKAQRVFGGDKPFDLRCVDCDEQETCPESPFNLFHQGFQGDAVDLKSRAMCVFSKGIPTQDMGSCLIEYESGAQASYTQNFFARFKAARRGARLYGYDGTIEFDWYQNQIHLYRHRSPVVETIDFTGNMPHFGGDRELCLDFLRAMRDGAPSRCPLSAGIESALTCLWARESSETQRFCQVVMPE